MLDLEEKAAIEYSEHERTISPAKTTSVSHARQSSEHLAQYDSFLKTKSTAFKHQIDSETKKAFLEAGVDYDQKSKFFQEMELRVVRESINSEVMVIGARWGHFSMSITILKVLGQSCIHSNYLMRGSFGNVYLTQLNSHKFAIKCIEFQRFQSSIEGKIMIIKEFFLTKIASLLKIGPYIQNWLGFDIILFQNCGEIVLEQCSSLDKCEKEQINCLKDNLLLLHKYRIIHHDIKPENIMFSHHFNKPIFIDFGFSSFARSVLGQKEIIKFKGTLNYCHSEMIRAFYSRMVEQVDIYYNDCFGLRETIQKIMEKIEQERNTKSQKLFEVKDLRFVQKKLLIFVLKFALFKEHIEILRELFLEEKQFIQRQLILDFFHFFEEIYPTQRLKNFYSKQLHSPHKEGIQFNNISYLFSSQLSPLNTKIYPQPEKQISFRRNSFDLFQYCEYDYVYNSQNIKFILQNIDKFLDLERSYLYRMFLSYISYTNNVYNATHEQRLTAANALFTFAFKEKYQSQMSISITQDTNKHSLIHKCIVFIFKQSLLHLKQQQIIKQEKMKKMKSFLYEIVQHFFLLDIGKIKDLVNLLNDFYDSPFMDDWDRLEMIYKIRKYNYWLSSRFYSSAKQNSFTKKKQIKKWINQQMASLCSSTLPLCATIANYNFRFSFNNSFKIIQNLKQIPDNQLPSSFLLDFKYNIICKDINLNNIKNISDEIRQILQLFEGDESCSVKQYLFDIFMFEWKHLNYERCKQILQILKRNINDESILNQFVVSHILFYTHRQDISWEQFYTNTLFILTYVTTEVFLMHHSIITSILEMLSLSGSFFKQMPQKRCQLTNLFLLIQEKFIQKDILVDADTNINSYEQHLCLYYDALSDAIVIKSIFSTVFLTQEYSYYDDIKRYERSIKCSRCNKCSFIYFNFISLSEQNKLLCNIQNISPLQIQQFMTNYELIIQYNASPLKCSPLSLSFLKMNSTYLYLFCSLNLNYQQKYHGTEKLYIFFKQTNQIGLCFDRNEMSDRLLFHIIEIVYKAMAAQQLVGLLSELVMYIHKINNVLIYTLLHSFQLFMGTKPKLDFAYLFEELRKKETSTNNPFYIVYYYLFLWMEDSSEMVRTLLLRVICNLMLLPFPIFKYFLMHLYRYYMLRSGSNGSKRKQFMMIKQLVKSARYLGLECKKKNELGKLKLINCNQQLLAKNCLRYGGPYEMIELSNKRISMKLKRRSY